jgi:hypothetical protein
MTMKLSSSLNMFPKALIWLRLEKMEICEHTIRMESTPKRPLHITMK